MAGGLGPLVAGAPPMVAYTVQLAQWLIRLWAYSFCPPTEG